MTTEVVTTEDADILVRIEPVQDDEPDGPVVGAELIVSDVDPASTGETSRLRIRYYTEFPTWVNLSVDERNENDPDDWMGWEYTIPVDLLIGKLTELRVKAATFVAERTP